VGREVTEIHFELVWATPARPGHAARVIGCATSDAALDYSSSGSAGQVAGLEGPDGLNGIDGVDGEEQREPGG